ncbi:MAG: RIP metalloprotease RseP [Planctomycetota bacterium]
MSHLMLAVDYLGLLMVAIGFGGLIFIHELGHFLACRVTGTRVEAFSIGFGPKILGWRRGHTVYKLSLIPFGGYVKMAAENPGETGTGAPDEFPQKTYSQRLLIMSAGVIFNAVLAFLLFVWAFGLGAPFPRPEIGTVVRGGAAWEAGVERGDIVTSVNSHPVLSFNDLAVEVALSGADETLEVVVDRAGTERTFWVTPRYSAARGMPAIGVEPAPLPGAADVVADSPIAKVGGRKGDQILAIGEFPVAELGDAVGILMRLAGQAAEQTEEIATTLRVRRADGTEELISIRIPINRDRPQVGIVPYYGRRVTSVRADGPASTGFKLGDIVLSINGEALGDFHVFSASATGLAKIESVRVRRDGEELEALSKPVTDLELLDSIHCGDWDGNSARVSPRPNMPAARAGLQAGDTIREIAGKSIETWADVQGAIGKHGNKPLPMRVQREDGSDATITITPAGRATLTGLGYVFEAHIHFVKEQRFFPALKLGWDRTVASVRHVVYTLKNLLTARVSARHVGGPIAIAQMTYGMFAHGFAMYLYFLALISMNLAILNLLPIPVLDGGQILLLTAEKIRGAPLPERVVGYLQLVGVVMILSLIALALTNDISNLFR